MFHFLLRLSAFVCNQGVDHDSRALIITLVQTTFKGYSALMVSIADPMGAANTRPCPSPLCGLFFHFHAEVVQKG